jgi:Zn-dependent protease with chaperone function
VNPLSPGVLSSLFSDHPPTAERVARLRKMAFQNVR